MTRQLRLVDPKHIAFEMEDDLCVVRHLAKTIFALANDDDGEYANEIACLARIIMDKVDTLEDQRSKAAGQLTPAEHSA
jgi:hypothetical protein